MSRTPVFTAQLLSSRDTMLRKLSNLKQYMSSSDVMLVLCGGESCLHVGYGKQRRCWIKTHTDHALLLFLQLLDAQWRISCRILTTEFVKANVVSEIKFEQPKFACRILYIVFLNRFNILGVNSGRWIRIIEFLIMKICVKYFEFKYSQLT